MGSEGYKCKVSGDSFYKPGSVEECLGGDVRVDGVLTNIGPVSARSLPVYRRAVDKVWEDPTISNQQKAVRGLLKNADFVRDAFRAEAKRRVLNVLEDTPVEDPIYELIIREIRDFLLKGIDLKEFHSGKTFDKGLKLSQALACMKEDVRTGAFINAVLSATEDIEGRVNESFEVIDAGCGPIPLFGIIAALKSDKANVTCLEFNPDSVKVAKEVVKNLGLGDRVKIVECDATKYQHGRPVDLLVSETMYAGLLNGEEQVAIMDNIANQLSGEAVVLPKQITVNAGVVVRGKEHGDRVDPNADVVVPFETKYIYNPGVEKGELIEFEIPLSGLKTGVKYYLSVSSDVVVDDNYILSGNDSAITAPFRLNALSFFVHEEDLRLGKVLKVSYSPGMNERDVKIEIA